MRTTALAAVHQSSGARMVPFAGWNMPVQYAGILDEVTTVRERAGLFDLGHMGRVRIRGTQAEAFLQRLQTNDAAAVQPGRIRYAMILDEQGMVQDDILIYREEAGDAFFVVVNAGNTERDLEIMRRVSTDYDVEVIDQTDELGMIAIQGPAAAKITARVISANLGSLGYYAWIRTQWDGSPAEISRTGYTGEDGFEFYLPQDKVTALWHALMESGGEHGLAPIGLGARDTLRLEAGMSLYGHEIREDTTPLEANLGWAVKFNHDFIGRPALEEIGRAGAPDRLLVGLVSDSRRVPRQHYSLTAGGREIGTVCSGAVSPTLGKNIATAYVAVEWTEPGTEVEFMVRDKSEPATIATLPFYKRAR